MALAAALLTAPAHAEGPPPRSPDVVADGFVGPLSLSVGTAGTVTVTQAFAGAVTQVDHHGEQTLRYRIRDPSAGAIAGTAQGRDGTYHLELTMGETGPAARVIHLGEDGTRTVLSDDLIAYEQQHNPDAASTYGFTGLDAECSAAVTAYEQSLPPGPEGGPVLLNAYHGIVESNAYQLAVDGATAYVADAAANAILAVDLGTGEISTVAVVPGSAITFTETHKAVAEGMFGGASMPDCVVGASYTPEPVPTDVEIGADGQLYVSTLQGALGEAFPLSTVHRIDPASGEISVVADRGMQATTGLALTPNGGVLVAELFGNEISVITPGSTEARTLVEVGAPADVEFARGRVYATVGVFGEGGAPGNGTVVTYPYRAGR